MRAVRYAVELMHDENQFADVAAAVPLRKCDAGTGLQDEPEEADDEVELAFVDEIYVPDEGPIGFEDPKKRSAIE